jgi:hypothetical protein
MTRRRTQWSTQRGQAMTELIITMPVIAAFFVAVFYFGYGMNQKIENAMAVRWAAFSYGTDKGRDPDDMQRAVTSADLKAAFLTRNRNIQLSASDWNTPSAQWTTFVTDSFVRSKRFWREDGQKWRPNNAVSAYLGLTGLPRGARVTTRSTIDSNGIGFRIPFKVFNPGPQVAEASLYVDQTTRKLETVSFNLGDDPFDPRKWDFGYLPVMLAYMGWGAPLRGWDWDFASNCMSLLLLQMPLDTQWGLAICPGL